MPIIHEGQPDGLGLSIGIVVARFNEFVTQKLLDGALRALKDQGVGDNDIHVAWVPGAFELGQGAMGLVEHLDVDGLIALGAVIRGETSHYDFVCSAATDQVWQVGLQTNRPFMFGVLTVDTPEQALERCSDGVDNKGYECALGALEMIRLRQSIASAEETEL